MFEYYTSSLCIYRMYAYLRGVTFLCQHPTWDGTRAVWFMCISVSEKHQVLCTRLHSDSFQIIICFVSPPPIFSINH
jgi:hypothetical protein